MISQILQKGTVNKDYVISGWVRTKRGSKHVAFIMLNDGSCLHDMQIIIDDEKMFTLAFLDELWQNEKWGTDFEAANRHGLLRTELQDVSRFLALLGDKTAA